MVLLPVERFTWGATELLRVLVVLLPTELRVLEELLLDERFTWGATELLRVLEELLLDERFT